MRIYDYMVNELSVDAVYSEVLQSRYLEYPPDNKEVEGVLELHTIGKSAHYDFRVGVNDHLVGFSIVGFNTDQKPDINTLEIDRGYRAETKASQPKVWLFPKLKIGDQIEFEPGEIGAGEEAEGSITILDRFKVIHGTHKPYFVEYFIKGTRRFNDWTRVVFTAIGVKRIDPESKEPTGNIERMWRFLIPKNQMPYALSKRAIDKKYKPPKGIVPFPEEWAKKNYPEEYERWIKYIGELSRVDYAIAMVYWMGSRAKSGRNLYQRRFYLLLRDKETSLRVFLLDGNPLYEDKITCFDIGRASTKWLDTEGEIPPSLFNPNKKVVTKYEIISKGDASYEVKSSKPEHILLDFKKGLGTWELIQDEDSDLYVFERTNTELSENFVLHRHILPKGIHYDIRISSGWEINLFGNPLEEDNIECITKKCSDIKRYWVTSGYKDIKVGDIPTRIEALDHGSITVLNMTDDFKSFLVNGKKLKGFFVILKRDHHYIWKKSEFPEELSGDPAKGEYFDPFKVVDISTRPYFRIEIYDMRYFTRCETQDMVKKYYSDVPEGVRLGICLFPRENKLHGARIAYVNFDRDKWNIEKAIKWIKEKKLYDLLFDRIIE